MSFHECPCCEGRGQVSEDTLARWQRMEQANAHETIVDSQDIEIALNEAQAIEAAGRPTAAAAIRACVEAASTVLKAPADSPAPPLPDIEMQAKLAVVKASCGLCALSELELLRALERLYIEGAQAGVNYMHARAMAIFKSESTAT